MTMLPIIAQTDNECQRIIRKRLNMIEFQHIGAGLETNLHDNLYMGPKLFYGLGSYRNLLNVDVGIKYLFCYPFQDKSKERRSRKFVVINGRKKEEKN